MNRMPETVHSAIPLPMTPGTQVKSPLPGTVLKVNVAVGDAVKAGDGAGPEIRARISRSSAVSTSVPASASAPSSGAAYASSFTAVGSLLVSLQRLSSLAAVSQTASPVSSRLRLRPSRASVTAMRRQAGFAEDVRHVAEPEPGRLWLPASSAASVAWRSRRRRGSRPAASPSAMARTPRTATRSSSRVQGRRGGGSSYGS